MIPYGRQSINDEDITAVMQALKGDFLTTGPLVQQFEKEIEKVVGAPCVVVSSGTAALHCAFAAIGLKAGDEVITPPITFIATQATAAQLGARIVFADVLKDTATIDPIAVRSAISPRTRAIVTVDYAGHPSEIDELRKIAEEFDLFLIEDAAHSIGSTYRNRSVGSLADLTTFSFFPTKNLTTGEGGAISSNNKSLLEKAKKFARQGLIRNPEEFQIVSEGSWHQEVHEFGLNYRLPDILCALGLSQINRISEFKSNRRRIFDNYVESLVGLDDLKLPTEKPWVNSNWHLFPIRVPATKRKKIFENLRANGIAVQVNYLPAYRHPVFEFANLDPSQFPESELFYSEEISLPMFSDLTENQQTYVIETLKATLKC